jgi:hypothetical protein
MTVPGIGEAGQRRISSLEVEVRGEDLAAEICALYLAGAGVKRLVVCEAIAREVRALNAEVELGGEASLVVEPAGADPLLAGARAARALLAQALGGGGA